MASLRLHTINEEVLIQEALTAFVVDEKGNLDVQHTVLRRILQQTTRALNTLDKQVKDLQAENDEQVDRMQALEQQCTVTEQKLREVEETNGKLLMQVCTMTAKKESDGTQQEGKSSDIDSKAVMDKIDKLNEKMEWHESYNTEAMSELKQQVYETKARLDAHANVLSQDVEPALARIEDMALGAKSEIEAMRQMRAEDNSRKADKDDLLELTKQFGKLERSHIDEKENLRHAQESFKTLDNMIEDISKSKQQIGQMWKVVKTETLELREWASKGIEDLRQNVRTKIDWGDVTHRIDELRDEVMAVGPRLHEASARVASDMEHKANTSMVLKLQESLAALTNEESKTGHHALAGTKCIACDRPIVGPQNEELDRQAMQAQLVQQLERHRERASPPRQPVTGLVGTGKMPPASPDSRPGTSPAGTKAAARHSSPVRCPAREMPPLVRVMHREAANPGQGHRPRGSPDGKMWQSGEKPKTAGTIRAAMYGMASPPSSAPGGRRPVPPNQTTMPRPPGTAPGGSRAITTAEELLAAARQPTAGGAPGDHRDLPGGSMTRDDSLFGGTEGDDLKMFSDS
eukprot:gnl/TRDRNA2_/TRDRNA2_187922_c0_seq1.p1 gnl/TRDRNA2_/TRDRNA2_187922_c0~~gnl/TRDRNA2_/TRDRNA2_187922_c0_seq1.p1  ORF type:complete len:575 (+),score=135.25 gnl/TRDRNA2_/TRDRNA2_187922_c0_seq1:249-1973(+)